MSTYEEAARTPHGQAMFRDLIAGLDALPRRVLITGTMENVDGDVCAMMALHRFSDYQYDCETIAEELLIRTRIIRVNDSDCSYLTPSERWAHVRAWAQSQITETP